MGANHFATNGYLMNPSVCSTCDVFSATSRLAINNAVQRGQCTTLEAPSDGGDNGSIKIPTTTTTRPVVCRDSTTYWGYNYIRCSDIKFYTDDSQDIICNRLRDYGIDSRLADFGNQCPAACGKC